MLRMPEKPKYVLLLYNEKTPNINFNVYKIYFLIKYLTY